MTSYRIETSCALTGAYQYTLVVDDARWAHAYCTAGWRAQSVHVVYALPTGVPPRMVAVFAAGRKVSPLSLWPGDLS